MVSSSTQSVVDRAKKIYAERLQAELEAGHRDRFVAIEPESGDSFLGDTLLEVAKAAAEKYPDRKSHAIRIGHRAVYHIGGAVS